MTARSSSVVGGSKTERGGEICKACLAPRDFPTEEREIRWKRKLVIKPGSWFLVLGSWIAGKVWFSDLGVIPGEGIMVKRQKTEGSSWECPSSFHVLAVDDSTVDRKVIERLLKISAYKVTTVDSGRRALQFLGLEGDGETDGLKVNMIITDYCMPGMTGYELLKKIKESTAFREIPVVIMSSENVLARIDRCLEEGAEEFIVKPVKLSDVKRLKDYLVKKGEEQREARKRKASPTASPDSSLLQSSPSSSSSSPSLGPPLKRTRT